MEDQLIQKVLKTIRNYRLFRPGDNVLVAVSGGPDSVFLLHALVKLRSKLKLKRLAACNLDHGLRGAESQADSRFVKKLAKASGIVIIHKRVDLKRRMRGKLSTEELAREERYRFFRDAAARTGANVIATGHTLDDQAETVLMRIIKGASLKGVVGIAPSREYGPCRVVRPLIELEKREIVDHLDGANLEYRVDLTNLETKYFRNIVRREIIPFLEKYNPKAKRALFNLAEHLREDYEFIGAAKSRMRDRTGSSALRLADIAVQPRALQKEILRDQLEKAGGLVKKLSFRHWKELERLVNEKRTGKSVDLPGSVRATRTADSITFRRI